jgi:hypothetical protein
MLGLTALPTAWKVAGGAIALLLLAGLCLGLYIKGRSDGEAAIKAADAVAIKKAQDKADDLANQLVTAQAAKEAATAKTVTVYRDRIINAPSTSSCGPSVRAAADGVRALIGGDSTQGK